MSSDRPQAETTMTGTGSVRGVVLEPAEDLEPVAERQPQVEQDQVGRVGAARLQPRGPSAASWTTI